MVSDKKLKECLIEAIETFYDKDSILIENIDGTERTCVLRIATYIDNIIRGNAEYSSLSVDCEYNKSNSEQKKLDEKQVQPDLIIHQRNINNDYDMPYNALIVEFKGCWNKKEKDIEEDIEKLKGFTSPNGKYQYKLGIFVKLGRCMEQTEFRYFKDGQEKNKNEI